MLLSPKAPSTFPPFEGLGMTTAMVIELITRSPHTDPNVEFFAHTLAEYDTPNAVRRKVGFEFLGKRRHAEQREIWKWRFTSV